MILKSWWEESDSIYLNSWRRSVRMTPREPNLVLPISTQDRNAPPMSTDKTSPSSKLLPWLSKWTKTSTLSAWDSGNGSLGTSQNLERLSLITISIPSVSILLKRRQTFLRKWKKTWLTSFLMKILLNRSSRLPRFPWVRTCLMLMFNKSRVSQREL